jgi:hypothetical protein
MSTPTAPEADILANGKKDWSRYNATVVGACWVPNQPFNPGRAPGLPSSDEILPYKNVFFGAQREWKNEDEGWQVVPRRSKMRRSS